MHCFTVITATVVGEPNPGRFITLTLNGELTIAPVVVDYQPDFNMFITVSTCCISSVCLVLWFVSCAQIPINVLMISACLFSCCSDV